MVAGLAVAIRASRGLAKKSSISLIVGLLAFIENLKPGGCPKRLIYE
jgi:hypothetical protein